MTVLTMQGDSQLIWSVKGEVSCSGTPRQEEPGIKLATFQLPPNPLYLLSHMPVFLALPRLHSRYL